MSRLRKYLYVQCRHYADSETFEFYHYFVSARSEEEAYERGFKGVDAKHPHRCEVLNWNDYVVYIGVQYGSYNS